jgi:non-specific serine/threonine protein kinase
MRQVWPRTFVSDESLAKCISDVRKALCDHDHTLVKTVPRRGYLLDGATEARGLAADGLQGERLPVRKVYSSIGPQTTFVGRAAEVSEILRLLGEERLVTLSGTGGCGKTRLALEVVRQLDGTFPDGMWWTDCAPLTDGRLIAESLAKTLGVRADGARPMAERLADYLRSRSTLLVLDNCEHLLHACAELADRALRSSEGVKILATSREPLASGGERLFPVSGLQLPVNDAVPDEVLQSDAVALYFARAEYVQPPLARTPATVRIVSHICTRLDGIPLAIELAAARGNVLAVEQIAARLDDRFRLLVGSGPATVARHQTLRAAMDWSYDSLTEAERQFLRRLSVFVGGWTVEAANDVCNDAASEFETINLLARLIDKSLVFVQDDPWIGRRYQMLETVRYYGHDQLIESGEETVTRDRHLAWFCRLARVAADALKGAEQSRWLRQLNAELDNLRAVFTWTNRVPEHKKAALDLAARLHWFWFMAGHLNEAERQLSSVLAAGAGDATYDTRSEATCSFGLGLVTVLLGDPGKGAQYLERSLRLAGETAQHDLAVVAMRMIVHGLVETGELETAQTLAVEASQLGRQLGTSFELGSGLASLAIVSRARHEYVEAARYFAEEANQYRADGNRWFCAAATADAAEAEMQIGNIAKAGTLAIEGLALSDDDGVPAIAWNLDVLARALAARGERLIAARLWGAAEAMRERMGLSLPGYWEVARAESVHAARDAASDDVTFDEAWRAGRKTSSTDAIALATVTGRTTFGQTGMGSHLPR